MIRCKIKDLSFNAKGQGILTLSLAESGTKLYDEFKDKELTFELKEFKQKRSLSANKYAWTLTDQLADKLLVAGVKMSKEECHAEMIFRYGQPLLDEKGQAVIYSSKQEIKFTDFFPYAKEIGESELNGEIFTHYKIYRGSHTYDSKEMTIFINGIKEECKEQGIETATPYELQMMEG